MSRKIFMSLQQDLKDLKLYDLTVDGLWGSGSQGAWDEAVEIIREARGIYVEPPTFIIQRGDSGEQVENLQRELKRVGHNLKPDGKFGPATERAVIAFQKLIGIVADGRVGEKTLSALQGMSFPESLKHEDLVEAANYLGVELAAIMAVSEVESRGRGFFTNGLPAILYERHIMRRRLIAYKIDPIPFITSSPDIVNTSTGGYVGGIAEYGRLERAKEIHVPSARESCSWGAYQIMGFHWKRLGYESIEDYVTKMKANESEHLKAFVKFIETDDALHTALKKRDWPTFATIYNGKAHQQYDVKMAVAFIRYDTLIKEGLI